MQNRTVTLVDVRSPGEYATGHAPNAINIPLEQIPHRLQELRSLPGPIVTYCRSGNRSEMARMMLQQGGLKEVYNGGGLQDVMQALK